MPINVACKLCGKALHVPSSAAGRNVRCPDCHASIAVPGDGGGQFRLTRAGRQKLMLIVGVAIIFGIVLIVGILKVMK
jgi:hypothetical protein